MTVKIVRDERSPVEQLHRMLCDLFGHKVARQGFPYDQGHIEIHASGGHGTVSMKCERCRSLVPVCTVVIPTSKIEIAAQSRLAAVQKILAAGPDYD